MNRRKALSHILLAGTGTLLSYTGYNWYRWNQPPDIAYLIGQRALLAALAETIIPATDSPGAKEAGVHDYIIRQVRDCTPPVTANKFIDGLKALDQYTRSRYHVPYEQCTAEQQAGILHHFATDGWPMQQLRRKLQQKYLGQSFFTTLKCYTISGYCTSEAGATRALAYEAVPGSYRGCVPLRYGQRAWATN